MSLRAIDLKKAKILIIDDNDDNVELATQILEDEYDILSGSCGSDCLTMAKTLLPDVILLDVQMPDMDGYKTLVKLRETEYGRDIPVIFLSARFRDNDRVIKGLELGAMDYITKPVDDDLLMAKVRVAVRIKQAEDTVRMKSAALEIANKEMEAFTYSVSHDLRAPLRTLDGFSKILLEDYADVLDVDGQDYLQRIRIGSQKMGSLIDDLLNFSRTSKVELIREPIDFTALAHHVKDELLAAENSEHIQVDIQDKMTASADSRLLRMVLVNLISNALKYSSQEDAAHISLRMDIENTHTVYAVEDNGVGFDMKYVEQLFHPFQRLHSSEEFPGNGIGLATVARIIQRHGGNVWAESELGKGSTFSFTLPLQDHTEFKESTKGIDDA